MQTPQQVPPRRADGGSVGLRYASVSEQLLDISMNKQSSGKLDRQALEKRLMELQGDVSRLVTKLSHRAKDESAAHRAAVTKLAVKVKEELPPRHDPSRFAVDTKRTSKHPAASTRLAASAPKAKLKPSASTSSIPGSRMGNLIRLQSDLHAANLANDKLRFDLDQMRRTLDAQQVKLREVTALQESNNQLKAHCASLQQSLDLSEAIRSRQKKMLHDLKKAQPKPTGRMSSLSLLDDDAAAASTHLTDNQHDDDDDEWLADDVSVRPLPPPSPEKPSFYASPPALTKKKKNAEPKKKTKKKASATRGSFLAPTQASQQRLADTQQLLKQFPASRGHPSAVRR
ncbi:Aste57867_11088 [Aphanomyces stellatus]|uniref:Aste57867_11088 protein n=1 Tax=Aphanomyces stellatus TaxID=120398 RepID=A0A485KSF6_9STRA|nr:hypothetical protein As57867_011046 [Aphanomyces stellatus]VFT87955.1 Aste57867_11088 [Aphanomyces stellatus]